MLSWGDELNQMVVAVERQAKLSLDKIELIFERDGFSFDDKFKKHFMRVSYSRLVNQTEIPFDYSVLICCIRNFAVSRKPMTSSISIT